MQLLFEKSYEQGETDGLSILKGEIKAIPNLDSQKNKLEIPNIGWWPLNIKTKNQNDENILNGIKNNSNVYFIHSYRAEISDNSYELASIDYFDNKITAVIKYKNISACQFHPEKSGETGIKILKNFLV